MMDGRLLETAGRATDAQAAGIHARRLTVLLFGVPETFRGGSPQRNSLIGGGTRCLGIYVTFRPARLRE